MFRSILVQFEIEIKILLLLRFNEAFRFVNGI